MDWYKTLNIHERINMKEIFIIACGVSWSDLSFLFSMGERIEILYSKLVKLEILKPI